MLHITNGDSAGNVIEQSGVPGEVLPWRDVLHEGPVPNVDFDELRRIRAQFIGGTWTLPPNEVLADFEERDRKLESFRDHEEVVLWFEHDMYDQLQLIQILDYLATRDFGSTKVSLICIGSHPDVPNFKGLGELNAQQIADLFPQRQPVTSGQLAHAQDAWRAFRADDPSDIPSVMSETDLEFLPGALYRHLEQFPSMINGLSRTEQQILTAASAGAARPEEIFMLDQAMEERVFMGDATLYTYVARLVDTTYPLLRTESGDRFQMPNGPETWNVFSNQRLKLTDLGRDVLTGQEDWITLNGIDRWLGGVHLEPSKRVWRWSGGGVL